MMRIILAPFTLLATPAWAEVCDKARPAWNPAQGPLDALGEAALFLTSPLGAVVALVALLTFAVRSQALAVIALVLTIGVTLFLSTALSVDPIFGAQMQIEGCLGPTWLSALVYGGLTALSALRLWQISRKPL